jgi:hypothetical protein
MYVASTMILSMPRDILINFEICSAYAIGSYREQQKEPDRLKQARLYPDYINI